MVHDYIFTTKTSTLFQSNRNIAKRCWTKWKGNRHWAIDAGLIQATLSVTEVLVTEEENKPKIKSVNEFVTNCQIYLN